MSNADRFKEEIGWLKVLTGVFLAFEASLVGWLVQNYEPRRLTVTVATLAAVDIGCLIVGMGVRVYRCLKNLEAP